MASGYSAWHAALATLRIAPAPGGTQVAVELRVERSGTLGSMLFDVGGYYHAQMRKWLSGPARQLANTDAAPA